MNKVSEAESIKRQRVRILKSMNNFATRKESAGRNHGIYYSAMSYGFDVSVKNLDFTLHLLRAKQNKMQQNMHM
jgi:hypothetical protein